MSLTKLSKGKRRRSLGGGSGWPEELIWYSAVLCRHCTVSKKVRYDGCVSLDFTVEISVSFHEF